MPHIEDDTLAMPPLMPIVAQAGPAPEMIRPAAEVRRPVVMPMIPDLPQPSLVDYLQTLFANLAATQPEGQALSANIQRQQEQRRKQKVAQETQSLTGFMSTALASGDPEMLSSAITQMSKLKGIEPETAQALQQLQVKLGQQIGQDVEEQRLGEALGRISPQAKVLVDSFLRAGIKPSQLIQSGLIGQKEQFLNLGGGQVARIPGSGIYGIPGETREPQVIGERQAGAPSVTKEIVAEADRLGLTGQQRYDFIINESAKAQGARSFAQGYQGALGRERAEDELPVGEKAKGWMDLETGKRPPASIPVGELKRNERYVPLSESDLDASRNVRAALAQLGKYEELTDLFPKRTGKLVQDIFKVQGNKLLLTARGLAGDPQVRQLDQLYGLIPQLAKAAGDAGNVGEKERVYTQLAALTKAESHESAMRVLKNLRDIFNEMLTSRGVPLPRIYRQSATGSGAQYRTQKELKGEGW